MIEVDALENQPSEKLVKATMEKLEVSPSTKKLLWSEKYAC